VLLDPYLSSKETFVQLPFWNREYVGTGAYRLREWEPSSHLIAVANEQYPLGRPKIDEIEVRFVPSLTTAVANVLAGTAEMTLGRGFSIDQSLSLRDQWRDGKVEIIFGNGSMLGPQFLNPNPAIIADARFRRALLHGLDRQELADSLQGGLVGIAHSGLPPDDPTYADAEKGVVRYEYDPRKAMQMIADLGYSRGDDGLFRDPAGQTLSVPLISSSTDLYVRTGLAVADLMRRIGVEGRPGVVPDARETDREFRATFPGFEIVSQGSSITSLNTIKAVEVPLPENQFRGRNRSRYVNAELEAMVDRYYTTVPMGERMQILGQIVNHLTSNAVYLHLFHGGNAMAIGNRLVNVSAMKNTANAFEWDVK
jgi:peptide/nickel transport system substrate-binding protein